MNITKNNKFSNLLYKAENAEVPEDYGGGPQILYRRMMNDVIKEGGVNVFKDPDYVELEPVVYAEIRKRRDERKKIYSDAKGNYQVYSKNPRYRQAEKEIFCLEGLIR